MESPYGKNSRMGKFIKFKMMMTEDKKSHLRKRTGLYPIR